MGSTGILTNYLVIAFKLATPTHATLVANPEKLFSHAGASPAIGVFSRFSFLGSGPGSTSRERHFQEALPPIVRIGGTIA